MMFLSSCTMFLGGAWKPPLLGMTRVSDLLKGGGLQILENAHPEWCGLVPPLILLLSQQAPFPRPSDISGGVGTRLLLVPSGSPLAETTHDLQPRQLIRRSEKSNEQPPQVLRRITLKMREKVSRVLFSMGGSCRNARKAVEQVIAHFGHAETQIGFVSFQITGSPDVQRT